MAFMSPIAEYFTKQDLINADTQVVCNECREEKQEFNIAACGEMHMVCTDCCPPEEGWYGRLSAAGYLDCTDWYGPFKSARDALREVRDTYEVDEDGEELPDAD